MHKKQAEAFASGEWAAAGGSRARLQLGRLRLGEGGGDDVPIGDQEIGNLRVAPKGTASALIAGLEDELSGASDPLFLSHLNFDSICLVCRKDAVIFVCSFSYSSLI